MPTSRTPAPPVTTPQVKALRASQRSLGIDDETYRKTLGQYRVCTGGERQGKPCRSTLELSRHQARQLLTRLQVAGAPLGRPYGGHAPTRQEADAGVVTLATPAQMALLGRLRDEIAWRLEDGYDRWRRARLRIDEVRTYRDAECVIEGLKKLKEHGHEL